MWFKTMVTIPVVLLSSVFLGGSSTSTPGDGVINNTGQTWRVLYHQDQKQGPLKYIAVRLTISDGAVGDPPLAGDLTLWTSIKEVNDMGKKKKVYDQATWIRHSGLKGQFDTGSSSGSNDNRKLQRFTLKKEYMTPAMEKRVVTVMGFHYTGRTKAKVDKNRHDDQLIVRIKDLAADKVPVVDGDCDKQPPDEDVLTEDPNDPPDNEPPYDAE